MRGIFWLSEDLLASEIGLCYMELFNCKFDAIYEKQNKDYPVFPALQSATSDRTAL